MRLAPMVLVFAACGSEGGDHPKNEPPPFAGQACTWAAAPDLDPSPDVVEVELTASDVDWDPGSGTPIHGMGFGGTVPGPQIAVEVGQTLRVRFHNAIDMPTTIHWHGLRVPEAMDGIAQMENPVPPGGTFVYEFPIRDAGFYWYHTHMDTSELLEAGLYGSIVARAPGEVAPACEQPIVLDDVLLDEDTGQIRPVGTTMDRVMGRLGNLLLANGRSDRNVGIPVGDVVVLRLVNAANARHMDLGIDGVPLTLVGTDGGFLPTPVTSDRLSLAPGERAIVTFVAPAEPGEVLTLGNRRVHLHEEGGDMSEYDPLGEGENPVMNFTVLAGGTGATWTPPAFDLPPVVSAGDPMHTWLLEEDMMAGLVTIDGFSWPDVPMVMAQADRQSTFVIDNQSEMRHPFHIHGNRFEVVSIGQTAVAPAWKDTFDVPPHTAVTLVGALDNPGEWMFHCHILEHAEMGMAGMMTVE